MSAPSLAIAIEASMFGFPEIRLGLHLVHTDRRSQTSGFYHERYTQCFLDGLEIDLVFLGMVKGDKAGNRKTGILQQPLRNDLVHRDGGSEYTCANHGNIHRLDQPLDAAVSAVGAVKHRKDHVSLYAVSA